MSRKPVTIIGAGRAGKRAVRCLTRLGFRRITVVDPDPGAFESFDSQVTRIVKPGIGWLTGDGRQGERGEWIIPAVPLHLAYEWLLARLGPGARRVPVPFSAVRGLPGVMETADQGFILSRARGLCPPDCDERRGCSWTRADPEPLPETLGRRTENRSLEIIRSRALAPGLGGYSRSVLDRLLRKTKSGQGMVMVATACRCHGVIHALELNQGGENVIQS